jgi:peptidoglycan hydrolase-like amidase
MALLTKGYMFFYMDDKNKHPSIPEDAEYNAVDDPRIFQKYLGASFELYGTRWMKALATTEDEYISYDGYLPILPYFHCSAGFTKSARDNFGRTDTPWLQSKLDVATCQGNDFE